MLDDRNKVEIPNVKGGKPVKFEVNYNPGHRDWIRVKIGEEEATISFGDLYGFIFVAADEAQQEQLMPVRQTQIRKYVKQHRVIAKKDIKMGQAIIVNCSIDVPLTVEEGLRGLLTKKQRSLIARV